MINIAARIRATGESAGRYTSKKIPVRKVKCQGCGADIFSDQDLKGVEYVKTKRGTEIFFHRACMNEIWKRKIV